MPMNPRLLRPLATGFNPKSIANLAAWYDASVASSLTLNGNTVSQWSDLSGNGRHAVQGSAALQPNATTRTQNGLRVLDFDGSKGLFIHSPTGSVTNLAGAALVRNIPGLTIIAACRFDTNAATQFFFFAAGAAGATTRAAVLISSGNIVAGGRRLDADSFASVGYAHNANSNIISSVLDYSNSDVFIYENGTLKNSSTSFQTNGNTQDGDSASVEIGSQVNGTVNFFDGFIGELLVFQRALSAAERHRVERALGRKWGITVA